MKAKKSLGQNFLKSKPAIDKIIAAGEIRARDLILEIGPGRGALTKKILEQGAELIAVEKDRALFEDLRTTFAKERVDGNLNLAEGDILDFDIERVVGKRTYKIIANIPYNITGAILKKFLTARHQPTDMILMVQYEVAKRILGQDARGRIKESILSISVKAYGEPKLVTKVSARYFSPAPKVDSAVIAIRNISKKAFFDEKTGRETIREEKFWRIVHAGFAHKRKKLTGNLKGAFSEKKKVLSSLGNTRAEDVSLAGWLGLAAAL